MKKSVLCLVIAAAAALLMSCASTKKAEAFPDMYSEKPVVMLVMPPINNSNNVEAKDYFYTTLNVPVAEAGYYVLPPALVYNTLQRESAYDAEMFIEGDLKKFNQIFGADVAIFTVIKSWEKNYIGSSVNIEVEYIFRSTKTNQTVYRRDAQIRCDTSSNSSVSGLGLIGAIANAAADAIKTAVTDYVDVAISCNNAALSDLPAGKYHPMAGADGETDAMSTKVYLSTKR